MASNKRNRLIKGAAPVTPVVPADTKKGGVNVSNAATIDPNNPIPLDYNSQVFISRKGVQYIPFLNPSDNFAQILLEAKLLSPSNLSCVNSKAEFCLGTGISFTDVEEDPEFDEWKKAVNRKQESLNDIIKGAFNTHFTCGNGYIEIVRGQVGSTRFVKIYKRNFLDCRLALPDEDDMPTHVIYSKEFRQKGMWTGYDNDYLIKVPLYSTNIFDNSWWKDSKGFEHTFIHLKNEIEGYDYYGMPSNIACLPQQILEYKAARSNLDNFDNNLVLGGTILLKGNITKEEAKKIGKQIVYQHSGDGKRGRFAILSSESGALEDTKIDQFQKQRDGDYISLDAHTEDKIISANQWDPFLAGMHRSTGMGSNSTYIRSIFDIKNKVVIQPAQEFMIEKFLNPLLFIVDDFLGTSYTKHTVSLKTVLPVSFMGDIDINAIMTKDEGRAAVGLGEAKQGGDEFIKTNNKGKEDVPPKSE